ncbi:MAG: NAD(P)H-quinone oxidoreductase [Acidobacteria bacterium]|nr:NAD(P)H-quinone oxidoreductase [Acidobacteriota bacterium]
MKAVFIKSFGPDLDVSVSEVAEPAHLQDEQVLVRVKSAGLNRADLIQARGHYPPPPGYSPNIPGLEFAGEIAAVGEAVEDWKIGERVFGITAGEAQAEFLLTDGSLIARIPDNLSFNEAAAIPEAFITAHDALVTQCGMAAGDEVLIHAVGSGVGLAGMQIAKANGCFVIGTSRTPDKIEQCKNLGLDVGLTVGDPPFFSEEVLSASAGKGADIILDLVGAAYFQENIQSLALRGRLILVGLTSGAQAEFDLSKVLQKRAQIIGTVLRARSKKEKAAATSSFVRDIIPHLISGAIRPNLDHVFAAGEVVNAYKYLGSNKTFGKVVLEF